MDIEKLTEEQQEKLLFCETAEQLAAFVQEEGIELSDKDIEGIAAGKGFFSTLICSDTDDLNDGEHAAIRKF